MTNGPLPKGIERLPSGGYRVRVQRSKKSVRVTCASLSEAIQVRDAIRDEITTGNVIAPVGQTVEHWGRVWLRQHRSGLESFHSDRSRFLLHVATADFASLPVGQVARSDIESWLIQLKTKPTGHRYGKRPVKPLGWQTRKHCLKLVRALFADAVAAGLCIANPATGLSVSKPLDRIYEDVPREWPLQPDEQTKLLELLEGKPEKWMVQFAMGTGLRQGEQWNLELRDVDVDGPNPFVFVRWGGANKIPKGRRQRKVPLFGLALEAMREWMEVLPRYSPHNPHGLVFPTPAVAPRLTGRRDGFKGAKGGARRGKSKVPAAWRTAKQTLGRPLWWHLLRHTAATSLLCGWWGQKWTLDEVAALLGHSTTRTTEMYAHFLESALLDLASRTQQAWLDRSTATNGRSRRAKKPTGGGHENRRRSTTRA